MTTPVPEQQDTAKLGACVTCAPGDRITIMYPEGYCNNISPKRVCEVVKREGVTLTVTTRPQGHVILVDLEAYNTANIIVRPWTVKDGWPTGKASVDRLTAAEKKQQRAKISKGVRKKNRIKEEDDVQDD